MAQFQSEDQNTVGPCRRGETALGLWEDAQREVDERAKRTADADAELRRREADALRAQQLAIREFVDGMHRLGIPARKHRVWKTGWYTGDTVRSMTTTVEGWCLDSPRGDSTRKFDLVVTSNASVVKLMGKRSEAQLHPNRSHVIGGGSDWPGTPLVELLRSALIAAMAGSS